jgi:hypothetical protein
LEVSGSLLDIFASLSDPALDVQVCDLATKLYSVLWNTAILLERQGQATPLEVCQIRLTAIRLLACCHQSCDFLDKAVLAVNVFEHKSKEIGASGQGRKSNTEKRDSKGGSSRREKSKQQKNASKQDRTSGGGSSGDADSPHSQIFATVVLLLEAVLKRGKCATLQLVKLVVTIFDFLVNNGMFEQTKQLKSIFQNLNRYDDSGSAIKLGESLPLFWALASVVECLCEEFLSVSVSKCGKVLCSNLDKAEKCVKRLEKNGGGGESETVTEIFAWFLKQIKCRQILQDVLIECLHPVLQSLRSMQTLLKRWNREGEGGEDERERRTKACFDAHRCWLILFHKALASSAGNTQGKISVAA